ncbi:MAG: DUF1194 domain-containing protein [Pseudomonadota bacterium]
MIKACQTAISLAFFLLPAPAFACRLALVLAIDVSASIDQQDYALQRDGLANALRSPDVVDAFLSSPAPVALAAYEWSGPRRARLILDWTMMSRAQDLLAAADQIGSQHRYRSGSTSIGYALNFGAAVLDSAPACARKTLDLSGDGLPNEGDHPQAIYRTGAFDGVTVNALAIGGSEPLETLVAYLTRHVLRGHDAFVEVAIDHRDFETAMRRKLVREVQTRAVGHLTAP